MLRILPGTLSISISSHVASRTCICTCITIPICTDIDIDIDTHPLLTTREIKSAYRTMRLRIILHSPQRHRRAKPIAKLILLVHLQHRTLHRPREILKTFLLPGLVRLREHDDHRRIGRLVPDHAPDVSLYRFFRALVNTKTTSLSS